MFRKKFTINQGLVVGILIYSAFVSILFIRMKNAEKLLVDYSVARSCILPSNCRKIIKAEILDYGSSKVSFTNYGPKGIPLESGSFEEYLFSISMENSDIRTIKVLPNTPSNINSFDVKNIYVPTKSDQNFLKGSLFDGKIVYVEIWRDDITLILLASNVDSTIQTDEKQTDSTVSISPSISSAYETVLPTENHPVIITESAKSDFTGWTSGVLFMILSTSIFGTIAISFFYGIDWIIRKWRKDKNQIEFGLLSTSGLR